MVRHPAVRHPRELFTTKRGLAKVNDWVTDHLTLLLASAPLMYVSFILPLVALKIPALLTIVGLFSSYWIQLWALVVLQRSANRQSQQQAAKADVDHESLSHIADRLDISTPGGLRAVLEAIERSEHAESHRTSATGS